MLTWNEIRARCAAFSERWKGACDEDADAKSFWDELFTCFGANRRQVASFESPVRMLNGNLGYIDLLWKGTLLVEHKSRGKDLTAARSQGKIQRVEYLFALYERLTAPLALEGKKKKKDTSKDTRHKT